MKKLVIVYNETIDPDYVIALMYFDMVVDGVRRTEQVGRIHIRKESWDSFRLELPNAEFRWGMN